MVVREVRVNIEKLIVVRPGNKVMMRNTFERMYY